MTSASTALVPAGLFDSIGGLPAHPLIVHGAIGLVAVAALGGVLSLVPRWRSWMLPSTAVLSAIAAVFTVLATESGESLEHRVARSNLIEEHSEWGERTRTAALLLTLLLAAWWWVERSARRASAGPGAGARRVALALGAATAVVAVLSVGALVVTGDQGARAVWGNTPAASSSGEAAGR